ncbi:MAG: bifunctional methylenetetrahydrofolate dehydrogenase/methenyltetrahydrofolate cyclohydrolase, partial [Calditrichales bacterium]
METKLIDGKMVSARVREEIKKQTAELRKSGIHPGLVVVL